MAAVLTLLGMSLNIGGLDNIGSIVGGLLFPFAIGVMLAFGVGLFLNNRRLLWSAVAGVATGLLCGFLILFFVTTRI